MRELPKEFQLPLEKFYQWESERPDDVWLTQCHRQGDTDYTWSEAGAIGRRLAAGLLSLGLEPGDRIGLYAENSARWFLMDLGIMMAGLVSVPIYTTMPEEKIRYVVEHSGMRAMFVGNACAMSAEDLEGPFQGQLRVIGSGTNLDWDGLLDLAAPLQGNPQNGADDLWSISYTSGTTGKPKGVMHSFSTMAYSAWCLAEVTKLGVNSRFFSYLPLAHIAERCVVELHSFYTGGRVGFNQELDTFVEDLRRIRPTYFMSVPRIWANLKVGLIAQLGDETWNRVLNEPEFGKEIGTGILESLGLDSVVWAQTGSAPIPPGDIRAWRSLGLPLVEGFGQSETMSGLCNTPDDFKIGTIGKTLPPGEVKISDEGEILLKSLGNMLGYYNDPEKTAETIVDGWIRTGDKGVMDEDGFVTITGRVKEIFKTAKGKYVAPGAHRRKILHFSWYRTGVSDWPWFATDCDVGRIRQS